MGTLHGRVRGDELGFDADRVAIGGDGAGGNLAAAATLKCRELGLPLHAQLPIYPPCDFDRTRPSCMENADGPLLRVAGMARPTSSTARTPINCGAIRSSRC